ncbi:MAG TPA: cytochrome c [Verrucomicrobiae bacterium]|nr:cytochrome c [Verrucomicrobiae bacterium]
MKSSWTSWKWTIAVGGIAASSALWSRAESKWTLPPETAQLKAGPGVELASASCLLCHSADYLSMQPPLDRTGWQGVVTKMREKYGAPLPANQAGAIIDYLAAQYGKKAP